MTETGQYLDPRTGRFLGALAWVVCGILLAIWAGIHFEVVPSSRVAYVDLNCGRIKECRQKLWTRKHYEFDTAASDVYKLNVGLLPAARDYVQLFTDKSWLHQYTSEYNPAFESFYAFSESLDGLARCQKWHAGSVHGLDDAAAREVVLRSLQIMKLKRNSNYAYDYVLTVEHKMEQLNRPLQVQDLLSVEQYCADPDDYSVRHEGAGAPLPYIE